MFESMKVINRVCGVTFGKVRKKMCHRGGRIRMLPERSKGTSSVNTLNVNFLGERTARAKQF